MLWLKESEQQQHVIVIDNSLFKCFTTKVFEVTTKSSPVSLAAMGDGIEDLTARKLPQREEFHAMPFCQASRTISGRNFEHPL